MSDIISQRISDTLDTQLGVPDSNGSPINGYGADALNDDALETRDSILLDLNIPADRTYDIQVNPYSVTGTGSGSGSYELFACRINGAAPPLTGDFNANSAVGGDDFLL